MYNQVNTWFPEGKVTRNHRKEMWQYETRNREVKLFARKADAERYGRKKLYNNEIRTLEVFTARGSIIHYLQSRLYKAILSDSHDLSQEVIGLRNEIKVLREKQKQTKTMVGELLADVFLEGGASND